MDVAIWVLTFIILIFSMLFGALDLTTNMEMKHEAFESLRASNQNALLDLESKYGEMETLTTTEMVNQWLVDFVTNNNIDFKELTITFEKVESEPPTLLVKVDSELESRYFKASQDAVMSYYSGTMILSDD